MSPLLNGHSTDSLFTPNSLAQQAFFQGLEDGQAEIQRRQADLARSRYFTATEAQLHNEWDSAWKVHLEERLTLAERGKDVRPVGDHVMITSDGNIDPLNLPYAEEIAFNNGRLGQYESERDKSEDSSYDDWTL